jgi:hypothetical protein
MTSNHILPSHPRLSFLSVASYDSQGLRWKYSNPPPHGVYEEKIVKAYIRPFLTWAKSQYLSVPAGYEAGWGPETLWGQWRGQYLDKTTSPTEIPAVVRP